MKISSLVPRLVSAICILMAFALGGCEKQTAEPGLINENVPMIRVAQQGAYDTWPTWDLARSGEDKKHGFAIQLNYFDSGPHQLDALADHRWDIAVIGPGPALMGALKYDLQIVGIADDESLATTILAHPDSPIFHHKGVNPEFPDIYGSAADLIGKEFLVSTGTTTEVLLINYLKAFGLTEKDVVVTGFAVPQMLSAYQGGKGDAAVMWSPYTYTAFNNGLKVVADASSAKAPAVILIVAAKQFTMDHPELVTKFLSAYWQKAVALKRDEAILSAEYTRYLKEWSGLSWDERIAVTDMQMHLTYDLEGQLAWFDDAAGPSQVEKLLQQVSATFIEGGALTPAESEQLMEFSYINTTFMDQLAKEQGIRQ